MRKCIHLMLLKFPFAISEINEYTNRIITFQQSGSPLSVKLLRSANLINNTPNYSLSFDRCCLERTHVRAQFEIARRNIKLMQVKLSRRGRRKQQHQQQRPELDNRMRLGI